ncbi:MAG: TIGR03905 family TSCPD domain-containing protein [Christensenellaceae bacterium]|jgi:uncharacterized protein (TIGR03905 family)|nr:TIGR03905 family TSCPD domain-containing protein [Christensenellaceae bacterium]
MKHSYKTKGVCSRQIDLEIDDEGNLHNVRFFGGCAGNSIGLSRLCEGQNAREVAEKLAGTRCQPSGASCPDQLSVAIREALGETN